MNITEQDLLNAGIEDRLIKTLRNYLQYVIKEGDIAEFDCLFEGNQLTNSQNMLLAEFIKQEYCEAKEISQDQYEEHLSKNLAVGMAIGGGTSVGAGLGVSMLGFTTGGIIKGSIAAGIQSSIGAIEAGSIFATTQSIGATGLLFNPGTLLIAGGVGASLGLGYFLTKKAKNYINSLKKQQQNIEKLKD